MGLFFCIIFKMSNNNIVPIFEYILWNNCSNNCLFCHQKHKLVFSTNDEKIKVLDNVKNEILNINNKQFHILLVGGELFDISTPEIFKKFNEVIDIIISLMHENRIIYFYINTNLIYDINLYLIPFLNKLKNNNVLDRIKFTTSDDIYGRFTDNTKKLFIQNLFTIREKYHELPIVINSILTKQLCKHVIDTNISFTKEYKEKFNCYVNLLPYVTLDSELTPCANDVFKTLLIEHLQNDGYINKYIQDISINQDKYVFKYLNDKFVFSSAQKSNCGHVINFKSYCNDRNTCFICDIMELFKNAT